MKIGKTIIESGIKEVDKYKTRTTARAVIINNEKKILMLYSKSFNDYTFPGGGVKEDEDYIKGLKRELDEEIGAKDITIIKRIGHTKEIRYGISGSNSLYEQTSYYYLCRVSNFGQPNYVGREQEQGLEKVWVNIDEAINHNLKIHQKERQFSKGLKTVLLRENQVLQHVKELLNA